MKTFRIILSILLVGIGLIALLGDILDKDSTLGYVLSFIIVKFIGIMLIYLGYLLYKRGGWDEDYIDDDMDRLT